MTLGIYHLICQDSYKKRNFWKGIFTLKKENVQKKTMLVNIFFQKKYYF